MSNHPEYLAVIMTPYGGGSFYRSNGSKTKEETAKQAKRQFFTDWKSLFKPKKGCKIRVNILDVTGLDEIEFDESGFYLIGEENKRKKITDRKVELIEV